MSESLLSKIISRLKKRWPNRFELLPPDHCHFVVLPLPDGIRVNRAFIQLNYLSLSPFASPRIVFLVRDKELLLWFIRKEEQDKQVNRFLFPESLVLASAVGRKEAGDTILVTERSAKTEIVLLKRGRFCTQLVKAKLTDADLQQTVIVLNREHGLQAPQVKNLVEEEKAKLIAHGLSLIPLRTLPGFWIRGERDQQELLDKIASFASPILVFLLLTTLLQVGGVWLLKTRIGESQDKLAKLQTQVAPLLKKRKIQSDELEFWKKFTAQETDLVSVISAYQIVAEAVSDVEGELRRWSGVKGSITFTVIVGDAAALLDILRKNVSITSVRFDGSVKKDRKSEKQQATLSIELGQYRRHQLLQGEL